MTDGQDDAGAAEVVVSIELTFTMGVDHRVGDPLHASGHGRLKIRSDLSYMGVGVAARQDDALRHPCLVGRHSVKLPLEYEDCIVKRHLDAERAAGLHVTDPPTQRLLPG